MEKIVTGAKVTGEWIEQNKNTRLKQRMYVTKMYERLRDEYNFTHPRK